MFAFYYKVYETTKLLESTLYVTTAEKLSVFFLGSTEKFTFLKKTPFSTSFLNLEKNTFLKKTEKNKF